MKAKIPPPAFGVAWMAAMVAFYYALLALATGDAMHPFIFFAVKWHLLAPLFIGFGIQMFLFQKLRIAMHTLSLATAGASAGTSGIAMAACCAHHFADILPILGFMGAASVVTEYQDWFLAAGIAMNVAGAAYMMIKLRGARCCAAQSRHFPASHE